MSSNQKNDTNVDIGLWIDNLMDRVRIEEHLKRKGFSCEKIAEVHAAFIDLQNGSLDFEKMRQLFGTRPELMKRIGSYFPHVQIHLKQKMQQLGVTQLFPRSMFFADSAAIVQKIVEENA